MITRGGGEVVRGLNQGFGAVTFNPADPVPMKTYFVALSLTIPKLSLHFTSLLVRE